MNTIKVSFGEYEIGEKVTVVMSSNTCGGYYLYKGSIVGKRMCRGREYLIMQGEDGQMYDISMLNTEYIISDKLGKAQPISTQVGGKRRI